MVAIIPPASIFNEVQIPAVQRKQLQYEKYVISTLFPEPHYTQQVLPVTRRGRIRSNTNRPANPNFILKDNRTSKEFYVECRYRSSCIANSLQLPEVVQLPDDRSAEPPSYFIVLGLGGEPENPAQVFLINVKACKYLVLYKRHLKGKEIAQHHFIDSSVLWH